jgi:hypothetical protein
VSLLKIKIPSKNLGRLRCAEEFNSGVKGLISRGRRNISDKITQKIKTHIYVEWGFYENQGI